MYTKRLIITYTDCTFDQTASPLMRGMQDCISVSGSLSAIGASFLKTLQRSLQTHQVEEIALIFTNTCSESQGAIQDMELIRHHTHLPVKAYRYDDRKADFQEVSR